MDGNYTYMFIKAVFTLVFVLGILGLSVYAMKYFAGKSKKGIVARNPVKVISTSFLGPKKNLAIVDVAGEILVLGVTQASITCLARLESPDSVAEIKKYGDSKRNILSLFSKGVSS